MRFFIPRNNECAWLGVLSKHCLPRHGRALARGEHEEGLTDSLEKVRVVLCKADLRGGKKEEEGERRQHIR